MDNEYNFSMHSMSKKRLISKLSACVHGFASSRARQRVQPGSSQKQEERRPKVINGTANLLAGWEVVVLRWHKFRGLKSVHGQENGTKTKWLCLGQLGEDLSIDSNIGLLQTVSELSCREKPRVRATQRHTTTATTHRHTRRKHN